MTGIRCNITTTTISASIAAEVTSFIGIASRQEGHPSDHTIRDSLVKKVSEMRV